MRYANSAIAQRIWHLLLANPEGMTIREIAQATGREREQIEWLVHTMRGQQYVVSIPLNDKSRQLRHVPTQLLRDRVERTSTVPREQYFAPNVPIVTRALACRIPLEVHWAVAASTQAVLGR